LRAAARYNFSEVVLTELVAAIRNFSRRPDKCHYVAKTSINILVNLALDPPSDK